MVNFSFGFSYGWVAPAIEYLKSDKAPFRASAEELSWIASALFAMEMLFAGLNGAFTKNFGRKPMLVFAAFLQALGWLITILATSPTMLIIGRGLIGVSGGTHDIIWCMYLGEVTSPVERGVFGSILVSSFLAGIMMEFFLSLWLPYIWLAIIPLFISILAFVMKLFIVETPFYLITRGKHEIALQNLTWLRGKKDPQFVEAEFNDMRKYVEEEAGKSYGLLHVLRNLQRYKVAIVGVLIFTLAQPSGNIAILSFQTILLDLFDEAKPGANLTVIYGILQFVFINLAPFVLEKIGRKKPMVFGFGLTVIIHLALAYLFYAGEHHPNTIPYLSYIIGALFNLYGIIFVITIFPTVYVLKCELFPQEVKSLANCSATMTNAAADFVVVKLFMWIWSTFGLYVNFIVYAAISLLSVVYVFVLIPETRGKTLIEIQEKIRRKSQASQQKKISTTSSVACER